MDKIKTLLKKYKSLILYAFFGVCTTAVNVGTYYVSFNVTELSNVISTIIAWILAALFAYFTNKIWVFDSKSFDKNVLHKEIPAFLDADWQQVFWMLSLCS